jgi:hypothetical protein
MPRVPSSWLGHAYRQIIAASRDSFLGSGLPIVPPGIPELRGQPLLGSLPAFRSDLIGLLQTTSALGPLSRFRMFRIPIHVVPDTSIRILKRLDLVLRPCRILVLD